MWWQADQLTGIAAVVAAGAAVAVLALAGASATTAASTPTEQSYRQQSDAICRARLPGDERLSRKLAAVRGHDARAARELAPLLRQLVVRAQREVDLLRAVEPPDSLSRLADRWLTQAEHVIVMQRRELAPARAGDYAQVSRLDRATLAPARKRDRLAGQLGFSVCGGAGN